MLVLLMQSLDTCDSCCAERAFPLRVNERVAIAAERHQNDPNLDLAEAAENSLTYRHVHKR
jgi:hypothetical protein